MPTPLDFLVGIVLPALLAGLLLLIARRASWGPGVGAALAVGGGFVAAPLLQLGWRLPPREATDWVLLCAVGGVLLGASGLTQRGSAPLRMALRLLAMGGVGWVVLTSWRGRTDPSEVRAVLGLVAAGGGVAWSVLELRQPAPGWLPPALMALTAAGAALAIGLSMSVKLAMLTGALCAVTSAGAIAVALRLGPPTLEGAVAPFALVLAALLLAANFFSNLPLDSVKAIALAPCAALLPRSLLGERARRPAVEIGLVLVTVAVLALAVKLAFDASGGLSGLED